MAAMSGLRSYAATVAKAIERSPASPVIFESYGHDHAYAVLDEMVANARQSIDIISGTMDQRIWNTRTLEKFLNRSPDGRIRVLLEHALEDRIPQSSAIWPLAHEQRITAKKLPQRLAAHLCLVDRKHIRLETEMDARDALVTIGDPFLGNRLTKVFDILWNVLEDTPVLQI